MFACLWFTLHREARKIFFRRKWMVIFRLLICLLTLAEKEISNCRDSTVSIITAVPDCTGYHRSTTHPQFIQQACFLRAVDWVVFPKYHFRVLSMKSKNSKYYNPVLLIGKCLLLSYAFSFRWGISLCIYLFVAHLVIYSTHSVSLL